jgi:hypothetical protein
MLCTPREPKGDDHHDGQPNGLMKREQQTPPCGRFGHVHHNPGDWQHNEHERRGDPMQCLRGKLGLTTKLSQRLESKMVCPSSHALMRDALAA